MSASVVLSVIASSVWVVVGIAIAWFGSDTSSHLWVAVGVLCVVAGATGVSLSLAARGAVSEQKRSD